MQLTENDKMFLEQLARLAEVNREGRRKSAMTTSRGFLSKEFLQLFGVDNNAQGAWFFNVYVEFEPMFKEQEAKDWQQ